MNNLHGEEMHWLIGLIIALTIVATIIGIPTSLIMAISEIKHGSF